MRFPFAAGLRAVLAFLPVPAAVLLSTSVFAQTIIDIGAGTGTNGVNEFPAPYGNAANGARHQMLVLASELQAAGMGEGTIYSVAFNVAASAGTPLQGFTVSIGTTALTALVGGQWVGGLTPVWGPLTYTETGGWNTHTFDVPFAWDGISNLVVQTCFSNGSATQNAQMFNTSTAFTSVTYRATGNPNVCTSNTGNIVPDNVRPDLRFEWDPPMVPPTAAFTANTTFSCTPTIQFTDQSGYNPTGWAWDFGDGGTDTVQNPAHTFASDGTFTVTLIDTNAYGADTATLVVTINAFGPQPVPACVPVATGSVAGIGITQVSFGDIVYPSADATTEGYADRGCVNDSVLAGGTFDLGVEATATLFQHNMRAWVDWDNSGTFDGTELVLTADNVLTANTTVPVPVGAVLNTPLRLRVMADFNIAPSPQPCQDLLYGQAEDYALVVLENTTPPEADFIATPTTTCDGTVLFTDLSLNGPTSWAWDFGDGGSSTDQDPVHTYLASGTYTVTLIVTSAYGTDTMVQTDLVVVDLAGQLVPATCTPQTQSYCCGYGILAFQFAGINSTSPDGAEGYVDRSCGNTATVQEGDGYAVSVTTGDANPHDVYLWIDLDNNGDFASDELVWQALSAISPTGTVVVPAGTVYDTPLRLRLSTDVIGEISAACDQPLFGQVEDYACIVLQNTDPPVADFVGTPQVTCEGVVQFTDLSTNLPTGWSWDFGDGSGVSTDQDPVHVYADEGTYTVTLTATNAFGSDSDTQVGYIQVIPDTYCDTTWVPLGGPDITVDACYGVLTDDGGPDADYTPGDSPAVTIEPAGAEFVTLTFVQFAFETNFDALRIYDGPSMFSPLIGEFTGNGIGVLPGGGVITSTGGAITVQQAASPGPTTWEGFIANWSCSFTGVTEFTDPVANVWPQPSKGVVNVALTRAARSTDRVIVHDALGRSVFEQRLNAGDRVITFDLSSTTSGWYTLTLQSEQGSWTRSIVLN